MHTAVDVQAKRLVFLYCFEDLQKSLLPRVIGLFFVQSPSGIFQTSPLHKVVDVLEMVVKGHAVDAAVLGNIADSDFCQRFFQQQIFQGLFQSPFGYI